MSLICFARIKQVRKYIAVSGDINITYIILNMVFGFSIYLTANFKDFQNMALNIT